MGERPKAPTWVAIPCRKPVRTSPTWVGISPYLGRGQQAPREEPATVSSRRRDAQIPTISPIASSASAMGAPESSAQVLWDGQVSLCASRPFFEAGLAFDRARRTFADALTELVEAMVAIGNVAAQFASATVRFASATVRFAEARFESRRPSSAFVGASIRFAKVPEVNPSSIARLAGARLAHSSVAIAFANHGRLNGRDGSENSYSDRPFAVVR